MLHNEENTICILMACYNGENFIIDQLESLISQTYKNWNLFIRDDSSTDNTVTIIGKYALLDERIYIVSDNSENLGSCQNFSRLVSFIKGKASYIMFADQDDVWLPSKIEDTFAHMCRVEKSHENYTPILVYTNFQYVDYNMQIIESKKNYRATKVSKLTFANLLAQNPAYGCTMMLNKSLVNRIQDIPRQAENHDYWVALVASAIGTIYYLDKPTILYRQHSNNLSTNHDNNSLLKRFRRIIIEKKSFADVRSKITMALAFKSAYFDVLSNASKTILNEFIMFADNRNFSLLIRNIRNGVRRQTLGQTFLFYASILLLKKSRDIF